ncbi:MAG: glycoside hydrolase family 32 protein [Chloroflexi bacterium]|nr:glycoside hydrolase family 32 protein [Chloroflexota bacterium]
MSDNYAQILAGADRAVAEAAVKLTGDPQRPSYHLMTAANWINDPNGPVYHNGYWHIFFQHNPYLADFGPMGWGHVRSPDLVNWEHCPIAIMPTPGGYDGAGCWSGSVVIHEGVPHMLYSGVADMTLWSIDDDIPPSERQRIPQGYYHEFLLEIDQETQCVATSSDNLMTWDKHPANPVIPAIPEGLDLIGFRDPFLWKEADGRWYMLLGSGIKGRGGVALLYRSRDLVEWEYLNPLYIGDPSESGINWECPNFLDLGAKHMLVVSPHGRPVYWLGEYADHKFVPDAAAARLDWGDVFYAPNSLLDPKGRWLMWGWVREARPRDQYAAAGWASCLTLPREISLAGDGSMRVQPAEEMKQLRGEALFDDAVNLSTGNPHSLGGAQGDRLEISCRALSTDCEALGIQFRRSPDGEQYAELVYDFRNGVLRLLRDKSTDTAEVSVDACECPLELPAGEALDVTLYLDKSVVEVYTNGRVAMTSRIYPARSDAQGLSLYCVGGAARAQVSIWPMSSIWSDTG